jgi:hypothetical protein
MERIQGYNSSFLNAALPTIMKFSAFRLASALSLAALLAACGSGTDVDLPSQTAAVVHTAGTATAAAATNMPAPDCAADNCTSLRIIDANAEAYRYDAQRRAEADAASPQA